MKLYTKTHLWLEERADGSLSVGITARGDHELNGICYVGVEDNELVVESTKTCMTVKPPVEGQLVCNYAPSTKIWDDNAPVAFYLPGWKLDSSQTLSEEQYKAL